MEEYDKVESVVPRLRDLVNDSNAYMAASRDAREIYEARFAWGPVRDKISAVVSDLLQD